MILLYQQSYITGTCNSVFGNLMIIPHTRKLCDVLLLTSIL